MAALKLHKGRGLYSDVRWYSLDLAEPVFGFDRVHFMPYRITQQMINQVGDGSLNRTQYLPDIDGRGSGNIHPSFIDILRANEAGVTMQLVLVSRKNKARIYGPAIKEDYRGGDSIYHLPHANVPAANFFPMIEPLDELTPDEQKKQELLRQIAQDYGLTNLMPVEPTREDLLKDCRYYKGGNVNTYNNPNLSRYEWLESIYVDRGGKMMTSQMQEYEALGGKRFAGVPYALLIIMYTHWAKAVWNVKENLPEFYSLVEEYIHISTTIYKSDVFPSNGCTDEEDE